MQYFIVSLIFFSFLKRETMQKATIVQALFSNDERLLYALSVNKVECNHLYPRYVCIL